jgi:hypothetical protein
MVISLLRILLLEPWGARCEGGNRSQGMI